MNESYFSNDKSNLVKETFVTAIKNNLLMVHSVIFKVKQKKKKLGY